MLGSGKEINLPRGSKYAKIIVKVPKTIVGVAFGTRCRDV